MDWEYGELIQAWQKTDAGCLKRSQHALERECLRVDPTGHLSLAPHPHSWGAALTHPHISTDYCEAQPELITPPFDEESGALGFLHQIHHFLYRHLEDELLWPSSSPCCLPEEAQIPIAYYGDSGEGWKKRLYRMGLGYRYGKKMQTLSGVHYNFSLCQEFWEKLSGMVRGDDEAFVTESYLHQTRNFMRMGWLNVFLFGATPAVDITFLDGRHPLDYLDDTTLYGRYATSIRMSHLGYGGHGQKVDISFNSFDDYVRDLTYATTTPHRHFSDIGVYREGQQIQLNGNILQIEAEHYSPIRPKPRQEKNRTPIESLKGEGVAYLEARLLDINPFVADGVDLDQLYFLHIFLLYCLFKESPSISVREQQDISANFDATALRGRDPELMLDRGSESISLVEWGQSILTEMAPVAALLDAAHGTDSYSCTLHRQKHKLVNFSLTPSARIVDTLVNNRESFQQFGWRLAFQHRAAFQLEPPNHYILRFFAHLAQESHLRQNESQVCRI